MRDPWGRTTVSQEWREVRGPLLGLLFLVWALVGSILV